jgi:hypothetical protein
MQEFTKKQLRQQMRKLGLTTPQGIRGFHKRLKDLPLDKAERLLRSVSVHAPPPILVLRVGRPVPAFRIGRVIPVIMLEPGQPRPPGAFELADNEERAGDDDGDGEDADDPSYPILARLLVEAWQIAIKQLAQPPPTTAERREERAAALFGPHVIDALLAGETFGERHGFNVLMNRRDFSNLFPDCRITSNTKWLRRAVKRATDHYKPLMRTILKRHSRRAAKRQTRRLESPAS